MAPVASASDKLSGAVTLQVGSTTKTITLNSSDNTLSGLASAINSSASASMPACSPMLRVPAQPGLRHFGANGNITVSGNSLGRPGANTLNYSGTAGSSTGQSRSTGSLSPVSTLQRCALRIYLHSSWQRHSSSWAMWPQRRRSDLSNLVEGHN